jgi:hypothetical protein
VEEAESKRFVNEAIEQLLDVSVYASDKAK